MNYEHQIVLLKGLNNRRCIFNTSPFSTGLLGQKKSEISFSCIALKAVSSPLKLKEGEQSSQTKGR